MSEYDYGNEKQDGQKSVKGYQIIVIILALVLGALSFIYFRHVNQIKKEFNAEKNTLTAKIGELVEDFDNLTTQNDSLAYNLNIEKLKADSLMKSLVSERNMSYAKIRKYERELGTMRDVMKTYVRQIDSLNTLNQKLISENIEYRHEITSQRQRAEMAEEKADELSSKIRKGSIIKARDITLTPLNKRDKEVARASRADRLRVDFVLTANELAQPGERKIYVRITTPDGYLMADADGGVFEFEGEEKAYSAVRDVDYQNMDLGVSIYYDGQGITSGQYSVEVYMDGYQIGVSDKLLR